MDWRDAKLPPDNMRPVLAFVPGSQMGIVQETPDEFHVVYFKRGAYYLQRDDHEIINPQLWAEIEGP